MKTTLLSAIFILLIATSATTVRGADQEDPGQRKTVSVVTETEGNVLSAINRIRSEHGLPMLVRIESLADIARAHSRDMAKSGVLSHRDSSGRDLSARVAAAGVKGWRIIGENVGRGIGTRDNAGAIVSVWMESEPHRKNILSSRFNLTGIGIATAKDGTLYATQDFMGTDATP